jgi:[ribosomal protein S5]-alanine N-acetyltransferase
MQWLRDEVRLPELRSPRVVLRWLELEDAPELLQIYANPEVMAYWSTPPMRELGEARRLIVDIHRLFAAHSLYEWGIVRLDDARVIGTLTFSSLDAKNRRAEIGFALARDAWGHGYMSEAAAVALDFAFGPLGLTRIEADVDPRNDASLRLLERLGFVREGLARERWRVGGEVQDSVMLGLLRREWRGPPR